MHCGCVVVASELLILSLDLVKNRVGVMSMDMRKCFIGTILVGLIEKTTDAKVMKAITKMVEDWIKIKVSCDQKLSPSCQPLAASSSSEKRKIGTTTRCSEVDWERCCLPVLWNGRC